ncbi:MAG: response regulator transcription factor [Campylobacterales bacterium]|nr:response regulator transcription factor [Campylobacterales bacterium]
MASILLLEEEREEAQSLCRTLTNEGFEVVCVGSAEAFEEATFRRTFDLLLLEAHPKRGCGFEMLTGLRRAGVQTPAIFISYRSDVASISAGFLCGADDYIKKPYNTEEVAVRIKAALRRHYRAQTEFLHVGTFRYHLYRRALYEGEERITLTPYESKIVELFFRNRNTTVEKSEMLQELSGRDESSEASLRVMISHLRKIGLPIRTQWGKGYRLELEG